MAAIDEKDIEDLTDDELEEIALGLEDREIGIGTHPKMKEKQDIMNFFNNVLDRTDTTKVSNLDDNELLAIRKMQRAALYALKVDYVTIAAYIKGRAEIILASGLSAKEKGGFFLKLINTAKRQLEAISTRGKSEGSKRNWFGGRNKEQ